MEITTERIKDAARKYEELEKISKQYRTAQTEFKRCNRKFYKFERILLTFLFCVVFSIFIAGVVLFCSLIRYSIIYESIGDPQIFDFLYNDWIASLPKLMETTLLGAFALLTPLSLLVGLKTAKKNIRISTEKNKACETALGQFLKTNQEALIILPENYRYPLAANFIAKVLENGRADTLKEALNLYEEQLHRWKMEKKMDKMIQEQKRSYYKIWYI